MANIHGGNFQIDVFSALIISAKSYQKQFHHTKIIEEIRRKYVKQKSSK